MRPTTRGFKTLQVCTEVRARVIEAFIALANAIITRRLIRLAWITPRYWKPGGAAGEADIRSGSVPAKSDDRRIDRLPPDAVGRRRVAEVL